MHWPAGLGGRTGWVNDPVHLIDFMPTFCAVSGAAYPKQLNGNDVLPERGTSLLPVFEGKTLPARILGFEHEEARALVDGPWKLVLSKRTPQKPEWELYHLPTDRCEIRNVAAAHPELTAKLAKEWEEWAARSSVKPRGKSPNSVPRRESD